MAHTHIRTYWCIPRMIQAAQRRRGGHTPMRSAPWAHLSERPATARSNGGSARSPTKPADWRALPLPPLCARRSNLAHLLVFLTHVCARAAQRRAWPSHTQTHHHARRPRTDAEIASDTPGRRRRTKAWWRLSIRASCFLCRVPARVITRGLPPSFERPRSRLIVLSWCLYRARRTGDSAAVVVVVVVASSF